MDAMAATPASSARQRVGGLRRDPANGIVAGVCAGVGRRLGVDPLILRIAVAAATVASGIGLVAYVVAWMVLAVDEDAAGKASPRFARSPRAALEVALGVGLLIVALLLGARELGLPFSDAVAWPLVLVAAGGALIWRQSLGGPASTGGSPATTAAGGATPAAEPSPVVISRIGVGVTLVVAAAIVFLQITGALAAATDVALAALVVAVALGVIFAPWFLRLLSTLTAERAERIRSQERAEVAAHLHDSVLQTLALVQKRAGDPREVATLARRQERELRAWLSGHGEGAGAQRLAAALEAAAGDVEEDHGVEVDVVAVGDRDVDRGGEALVAAAREAMVNAAKFAGGEPVAVYAELDDGRAQVFVRDRGPGFDPAAVPPDRRGLRESIVGRMARHGGRATIHSSPEGTEVELVLGEATP